MTTTHHVEIAVIGAGIAGIATAYYLCKKYQKTSVLLIDSRQPMSFTTAQSGDNYRNWWPHPTMVSFTNHSIDLMERVAEESSNVLNMKRRGYVVATRQTGIDDLIAELHAGYGDDTDLIRVQNGALLKSYQPSVSPDWTKAPNGVDILTNRALIRQTFPSFSKDIANVIHIRRGGDIDGQQLGQYMLDRIQESGGKQLRGQVRSIEQNQKFAMEVVGSDGLKQVTADVLVNAAGPFAKTVAAMMNIDLSIENVFQQKIAFEDQDGAVPRQLPFSIDLDEAQLDWTPEEQQMLADDPDMAWLAQPITGGIHCRPEGGDKGTWVKLGWAYNDKPSEPEEELINDRHFDPQFPEIVIRGAAALNPALKTYQNSFPSRWIHYGGYYPMTQENWPLIGPLRNKGAFVVGALSGFGSMSACAAGAICASWIVDKDLPSFAKQLSPARYDDQKLMTEIRNVSNKGIL